MTLTEGKDQDRFKGALEQDDRTQPGNNSLQGQLGHRDQDPMLKSADTDFPEPVSRNPEKIPNTPEHTDASNRQANKVKKALLGGGPSCLQKMILLTQLLHSLF